MKADRAERDAGSDSQVRHALRLSVKEQRDVALQTLVSAGCRPTEDIEIVQLEPPLAVAPDNGNRAEGALSQVEQTFGGRQANPRQPARRCHKEHRPNPDG